MLLPLPQPVVNATPPAADLRRDLRHRRPGPHSINRRLLHLDRIVRRLLPTRLLLRHLLLSSHRAEFVSPSFLSLWGCTPRGVSAGGWVTAETIGRNPWQVASSQQRGCPCCRL